MSEESGTGELAEGDVVLVEFPDQSAADREDIDSPPQCRPKRTMGEFLCFNPKANALALAVLRRAMHPFWSKPPQGSVWVIGLAGGRARVYRMLPSKSESKFVRVCCGDHFSEEVRFENLVSEAVTLTEDVFYGELLAGSEKDLHFVNGVCVEPSNTDPRQGDIVGLPREYVSNIEFFEVGPEVDVSGVKEEVEPEK